MVALSCTTAGPQVGQEIVYQANSTTMYPAEITGVNADGTISLSYLVAGQTTLSVASNVAFDYTGSVKFPSWRYPGP